jgi:hypothetical protein
VKFDFDNWGAGFSDRWSVNFIDPADAGLFAPSIAISTTEGSSSQGAIELTAPFSQYGQIATAECNFGPSADFGAPNWTDKTALHARLKMQAGTGAGLAAVFLFVQTGALDANGTMKPYATWSGARVEPDALADGAWHDAEMIFKAEQGFKGDLSLINKVGMEAVTSSELLLDGGPSAPGTTILFLDSISLN